MFFPGIGQGRVTSNLQGAPVDDAVFVSDKEAVEMVRKLACLLTCIKYSYRFVILFIYLELIN